MSYYVTDHTWYCGIDLHARTMFVSVTDSSGNTVLHQNMPCRSEDLERALAPYREDVVVACECMFSWYWIADWCEDRGIPFVLGHALGMAAIHGGKHKSDSIDAGTIAHLLRTKYLPMAYVYPREMRATRDLLRRRMQFVHMQTSLLNHTQTLSLTYHQESNDGSLRFKRHREGLESRFDHPMVQASLDADIRVLDEVQSTAKNLEQLITKQAKKDASHELFLLRTIPGVGDILSLVLLYEINDIRRFATVQRFISYCRLITPEHRSAGKKTGNGNKKIGNQYLRWAFGEAAVLFLRGNERGQAWMQRLTNKKGKPKALAILAARIARTSYFMLRTKQPFNEERFYGNMNQQSGCCRSPMPN